MNTGGVMAKQHNPEFLSLVNAAKSRIPELTVTDVMAMLSRGEAIHLVDVREESEWAAGHIDGACHIGKGIIERDVEKHFSDKSAVLVLYCGGGFRSALAADALQQMGYSSVVSMDGGWRGWLEAGGATAGGVN